MTEELTPLATAKPKQAGGANQLLIDLGPIIVFVVAFNVLQRIEAMKENAVFIATGIFIAAVLAAIAYCKVKSGKIPPVLIVTGIIVVGFGGLTLALRDPTFIQVKPTFTYGFYVAAILFSLAIRQNVWKLLFGHAFNLPDKIWTILALRWCAFFVFQALLNEYIRLTQDFDFWLNSRPLIVFPLTIAFAALNTPIVLKHHREEAEAPPAPAPAPPSQ